MRERTDRNKRVEIAHDQPAAPHDLTGAPPRPEAPSAPIAIPKSPLRAAYRDIYEIKPAEKDENILAHDNRTKPSGGSGKPEFNPYTNGAFERFKDSTQIDKSSLSGSDSTHSSSNGFTDNEFGSRYVSPETSRSGSPSENSESEGDVYYSAVGVSPVPASSIGNNWEHVPRTSSLQRSESSMSTESTASNASSVKSYLEIANSPAAEPKNKFTKLLQNPIENIRNQIIRDNVPAERKNTLNAIWKLAEQSVNNPEKLKTQLGDLKNKTKDGAEKDFIQHCIEHDGELSPLDVAVHYLQQTISDGNGTNRNKTIEAINTIETKSKTIKDTRLVIAELNTLLAKEKNPSEKELITQTIKHYQAKELLPLMMTALTAAQLIHSDPIYKFSAGEFLDSAAKNAKLIEEKQAFSHVAEKAEEEKRVTLNSEELEKANSLWIAIESLERNLDIGDRLSREVYEIEKSQNASTASVAHVKEKLENLLNGTLTVEEKKYVNERLELRGAIGDIATLNNDIEEVGGIKAVIDTLRHKRSLSSNSEVISLYNKTIQVEEARLRVVETLQNAAADYIENPGYLGFSPDFTYLAKKEAARGQEVQPSPEMKKQLENLLKDATVKTASNNFKTKMERRLQERPDLAKRLEFEQILLVTLGRESKPFLAKLDSWGKQIGSYQALHEQGKVLVTSLEETLSAAKLSLEETKKNITSAGVPSAIDIPKLRDTALEQQDKIEKLTKEIGEIKVIADANQYDKWVNFYERQKYGMMMDEVTNQTYQASHEIRALQEQKAVLENANPLSQGMTLETKTSKLQEITDKLAALTEKRTKLASDFETGMRYMRQLDIDGVRNYPDRGYLAGMNASIKDILGFSGDYAKPTKEYYLGNVLQRDGFSTVESLLLLLKKIKEQPTVATALKNLAAQLIGFVKSGYKNPALSEALAGDIGHIIAQLSGDSSLTNITGRLFAQRGLHDALVGTLTEGAGAPNFEQGNIPPELIGLIALVQKTPSLIGGIKGAMRADGIMVLSQILGAGRGMLRTAVEKGLAQSAPRDTEKYLAALQKVVQTGDLEAAAKELVGRKMIQSGGETARKWYQNGIMNTLKDLVTLKSFRRWWNNSSGKERAFRIFGEAVVPLTMVAGAVGIVIATGGLALVPILIAAAGAAGAAVYAHLKLKTVGDTFWPGTDDRIYNERNQEVLDKEFSKNQEAQTALNAYADRVSLSKDAKEQLRQASLEKLSENMLIAKKTKSKISEVMNAATKARQQKMTERLTTEMNKLGVAEGAGSMRAEVTPEQTIAELEEILFSDPKLKWSDGFTGHLAAANKQPLNPPAA